MTLESKESPNRWWRVKGGDLSTGAQQVLRAILRGFLERAAPPPSADLVRVSAAAGMSLETALAELALHDMVVRDGATGTILGAYPFSAVATAHQVAIAGLGTVYAMCAVDALGIPYMLKRAATVTSRDAATDEPLRITIE